MTPQIKSAISTAVFCGVVLLLMIFVSAYSFDSEQYQKDNPPRIPPEGFEVSLGEPDRGQGDEPAPSAQQHNSSKSSPATSQPKTPTQKNGAGKVDKNDKTATTTTTETQETKINTDALYKGKTTNTTGSNTATGSGLGENKTPGNQGVADGSPRGGIHGTIKGRGIARQPKDSFSYNEPGTFSVWLNVTIDPQGKVLKAEFKKAKPYVEKLSHRNNDECSV